MLITYPNLENIKTILKPRKTEYKKRFSFRDIMLVALTQC